MSERKLLQAEAGWLEKAVESLCAAGVEVIAPRLTASGVLNLAPVTSAVQIERDGGSVVLPLKQFLMPASEELLKFETKDDGDVDVRPTPLAPPDEKVVIGCRPCDAASVGVLDKVFHWDLDDLRYSARRDHLTLVSFACTAPEPTCFCTSVGGSPQGSLGSDVLVFESDEGGALFEVLTARGERFVELLGESLEPAPAGTVPEEVAGPEAKFDPARIKQWLDENFESEFFLGESLRCLGCGACTFQCPTCHCFDIVDEGVWNRGERRRNWDSCAFSQFTLHASGHNPRPTQAARVRQRIMHKFSYFPERFGLVACVGCGRCIKTCGAGRNLRDALVAIESLQEGRSSDA